MNKRIKWASPCVSGVSNHLGTKFGVEDKVRLISLWVIVVVWDVCREKDEREEIQNGKGMKIKF